MAGAVSALATLVCGADPVPASSSGFVWAWEKNEPKVAIKTIAARALFMGLKPLKPLKNRLKSRAKLDVRLRMVFTTLAPRCREVGVAQKTCGLLQS